MRTSTLLLVLLALAPLALAGCASNDTDDGSSGGTTSAGGGISISATGGLTTKPPSGEQRMIDVVDNEFKDGNMTIPVGTSVMYMNEGQHAHTVTIHWVGDPATTTKADQTMQPGGAYTYIFDQPGTYHVWCRYHGTMTSGMATTVTVQ